MKKLLPEPSVVLKNTPATALQLQETCPLPEPLVNAALAIVDFSSPRPLPTVQNVFEKVKEEEFKDVELRYKLEAIETENRTLKMELSRLKSQFSV